jgi:hypothetical protein
MRVRSLLLFACMIVVPLLAMFSHKIPRELRSAARERLWEPARQAIAGALDIETPAQPAAIQAGTEPTANGPAVTIAVAHSPAADSPVPSPAPATPPSSPSMVVMPPVTLAPIDVIAAPATAGGGGLSVPASMAAAAVPERPERETGGDSGVHPDSRIPPEPPDLPPLSAAGFDRQSVPAVAPARAVDSEIRVRRAVEERLAALGAISFDCQPLQGTDGIHRCSCRVAADPTGQLQRVFQSSGTDPVSAMSTLLEQVTAWKQRIASRPDQQPAATSVRF